MQDPSWMGTFPSSVYWGTHSETIYFDYNPNKNEADSLYKIKLNNSEKILKVSIEEQQELIPRSGNFNSNKTKKVFVENETESMEIGASL